MAEMEYKNGSLCVSKIDVSTSLNLSDNAMTEFQQALKDSGFDPGSVGDWSEYLSHDGSDPLFIAEPRLAMMNIISDFNLTQLSKKGRSGAQQKVNYDIPTEIEFWDRNGNYFKKWTLMSGQGNSSMSFIKKGMAFDFFDSSVYDKKGKFGKGEAFKIRFGNWVPQDSFHIKAYYTDFFKGMTIFSYKLMDEVNQIRGIADNRPYKRYFTPEYTSGSSNNLNKLDHNIDTGARCMPDGFPVIVYQNGEFYGVYSFQLKKHRDNMQQDKSKANDMHLDGWLGAETIWTQNGNLPWDKIGGITPTADGKRDGFEVRNPKDLYCIDGTEYDADVNRGELADSSTVASWIEAGFLPDGTEVTSKIATKLNTTANVRLNLEQLSTYVPQLQNMVDSSATSEQIREKIEEFFDVESIIDYILVTNVTENTDAYIKNWQWTTWGPIGESTNLRWAVNIYDCDISFGCIWNGTTGNHPGNNKYGTSLDCPSGWVWKYYIDELKQRYQILRQKGIFDADHITKIFSDWMDRVGYVHYKKEYEKWDESPCNRRSDGTYTLYPTTGGHFDSIYRINNWIKERIQKMDVFMNYSN